MALPPRLIVFAALGAAPFVLLTGCGEDATGARTTLAEVRTTSYVVEPPVTTTTTTTTLAPAAGEGGAVIDPNEQQYIVQGGDSVFAIAGKFDIDPTVLANYNSWPEGINHPVYVGDIIKIPPNAAVPTQDTGEGSSTDTEPEGGDDSADDGGEVGVGCTHTVVAGDNPTRLSTQYEVTLEDLNAANANNPAYSHFQLGSQINIPEGGKC